MNRDVSAEVKLIITAFCARLKAPPLQKLNNSSRVAFVCKKLRSYRSNRVSFRLRTDITVTKEQSRYSRDGETSGQKAANVMEKEEL